jgi:nitrogen fixation/metabolism regulation signal transduction histidine kinase
MATHFDNNASRSAQPHKRQLRNYLLDRKLQLRYTMIMVVLTSALTAALGYFWYDQMRTTSRLIEVRALVTMSDEDAQRMQEEMASQDRMRLLVLVGFGVVLAFAIAGYSIVLTHKVAGPLFKISRYMNELREGRLGTVYDLRKGDQLQEFFETFKQMHASLRKQAEQDVNALEDVIGGAERHLAQAGPQGAGELARHLDSLRELRDRKSASLKG